MGNDPNAAPSLIDDITQPFTSPLLTIQQIGEYGAGLLPTVQTPEQVSSASLKAAATSTLSQADKDALVAAETNQRVQAGEDEASAAAGAQRDVTSVLMQAGADPSQAPTLPGIGTWIIIAVVAGLLLLLWLIRPLL
jgi:hypothetical protein